MIMGTCYTKIFGGILYNLLNMNKFILHLIYRERTHYCQDQYKNQVCMCPHSSLIQGLYIPRSQSSQIICCRLLVGYRYCSSHWLCQCQENKAPCTMQQAPLKRKLRIGLSWWGGWQSSLSLLLILSSKLPLKI